MNSLNISCDISVTGRVCNRRKQPVIFSVSCLHCESHILHTLKSKLLGDLNTSSSKVQLLGFLRVLNPFWYRIMFHALCKKLPFKTDCSVPSCVLELFCLNLFFTRAYVNILAVVLLKRMFCHCLENFSTNSCCSDRSFIKVVQNRTDMCIRFGTLILLKQMFSPRYDIVALLSTHFPERALPNVRYIFRGTSINRV